MIANTTQKMFDEEVQRLEEGYKTGCFFGMRNDNQKLTAINHDCDCLGAGMIHIDWYLTRSKDRKPVIRVKWHFPTLASRKVYRNGYVAFKKTWTCTTKEQKFPFTAEGLESALDFAYNL